MKHALLFLTVACATATTALAQNNAIQWVNDVGPAIARAKQTHKPLMFYVIGSSTSRDEDYEREHKRAFADPLVIQLSARFVPAKFSRSRYRDQLKKWNLREDVNMVLVFATPEGDKIGDPLYAEGVSKSLTQKMAAVLKDYRAKLYEKELREKLENPATTAKDLKAILDLVEELTILEADRGVAGLLKREDLDKNTAARAYDVLAALSTKAAVEALLERAEAGDAKAAAALGRCTPGAAEYMLDKLDGENAEFRKTVYQTVTKLCKIGGAKPAKFWEGKNERVQQDELKRVKGIAEKTARQWKEQYEEYR